MNPSDKDRSSSVLRGLRRYGPLERGPKPVARNVPRQCTNGTALASGQNLSDKLRAGTCAQLTQ